MASSSSTTVATPAAGSSLKPVLPPSSSEWFLQGYTPEELTSDFVIRSLRRRLWKALQEDNSEAAMRAYQATRQDFERWLEEEQEQRNHLEELASLKAGGNSSSKHNKLKDKRRRSSLTGGGNHGQSRTSIRRRGSGGDMLASASKAVAVEASSNGGSIMMMKSFYPMELASLKGPILQTQMNPSEPFIADDFLSPYDFVTYDHPARKELPDLAKHEREFQAKLHKRRSRRPRLATAFNVFRKQSQNDDDRDPHSYGETGNAPGDQDTADTETPKDDPNMTTPLHEAARIGSGDFIRFLLANGGDPNVKNGMARTALHMTSGGCTIEEEQLTEAKKRIEQRKNKKNKPEQQKSQEMQQPLRIESPSIPLEVFSLMKEEFKKATTKKGTARKAAKAMGRMMRSAIGPSSSKQNGTVDQESTASIQKAKANPARLERLVSERMDAVLAVLTWISDTGEGPSINAVDGEGRTALHYAAELGRSDICMAIVSNFGAMLTIIDEGARTPCELSGAQGHADLAAQLEARAVLYIDPYGVDDELMANMLNNMADNGDADDPRRHLVPPFNWFETLTLDRIGEERQRRLQTARGKLLKVIQSSFGDEKKSEISYVMDSAAKVGLSAALQGEDGDAEEVGLENKDQKPSAESDGDRTPEHEEGVGDSVDCSKDNGHEGNANAKNSSGQVASIMTSSVESPGQNSGASSEDDSNSENGESVASGDKKPGDSEEDSKPAAVTEESIISEPKKEEEGGLREAFLSLRESHVEKYLAYHKWNVYAAMKAFKRGPQKAFSKAGVTLPPEVAPMAQLMPTERACLICYDDDVEEDDWVQLSSCNHGFCKDCLKDYVKNCALSKMASISITCPHHECQEVISEEKIEVLVADEPDVAARINEATNEQFVSLAHDFKFCNHPGCPGIVWRLPQPFLQKNGIDPNLVDLTGAVCTACPSQDFSEPIGDGCTLTYEGVEDLDYNNCRSLEIPRKAHRFCFVCGEGRHWPVPCQKLEEWRQKIREEVGEVEDTNDTGGNNASELAQKMWIKANTRPCPQCNVPIEKNDGCNHMTCTNPTCRHEFCWICRKDWKLHSTATGGFFRCNIWQEEGEDPPEGDDRDTSTSAATALGQFEDSNDQDEGYGTAIHSAREAYRQRQEMARFLHHYTRWEAHGESAALEQNMGDSTCIRLAPVVQAAVAFDGSPAFNFGGKGLSFVHSAFTELMECRSVLKHSYAFSYFRYPTFYRFQRYGQLHSRRREKTTFERLQSELEMLTEQMSDIVARSHLRATQVQITFLTAGAAEKREEFSNLMLSILHEEQKELKEEEKNKRAVSSKKEVARPTQRRPVRSVRRHHQRDGSWPEEDVMRILQAGTGDPPRRNVAMELPIRNEPLVRMWACGACTYMNDGGSRCAMCGNRRM